jgi:hypothetical protein
MEKALFAKLIKSVREAVAIQRGEMPASRRFVVTVTTQKEMPTAPSSVKKGRIRKRKK